MIYIVMLLSVCLFSSFLQITLGNDELLQVQAVFRHGERGPMYEYSNKESEKFYYKGKSQLTDEGLNQAYKFGQALRRRYVDNGFLDKRYVPSEVKFRSSGVPRCMISTSAVGQAMFDKSPDGLPNSVELCIHQTPKKLLQELFDTAGLPIKQNKSQDGLVSALTDIWGKESKYFKHVDKLSKLTEPMRIEAKKGVVKPPEWWNKTTEEELEHILYRGMSFTAGTGEFHRPKWIRCRSGLLMHTIMENIKKRVDCKKDKCKEPKLYGYSTHEYTIQCLLDSFSIIKETLKGKQPPDAAAILIELWKRGDNHYVKLFYGKENKEFDEFTKDIPACKGEKNCPMERFTSCCDKYMTAHPADECGGSGENTTGI